MDLTFHPCRFGVLGRCCALALALLVGRADALGAQTPLHQRIDQLIAAGTADFEAHAAPLASDAEFLRRIYLDLAGTIPTVSEARTFLNDKAPEKRGRLIDRLLASPEYARRMQTVFDVMLMERRPSRHVPQAHWAEYLRSSFAVNKPWDQLVREILSADGADPKLRPAAKFYLDREGEPNLLTRDISRLFLGMNLQCAQCHDHPLVEAYRQDHYYGLFAFLNRSFLFNDKAAKQFVFAEKAEGDVSFQSVFDPTKVTKSTGPRMPGRPPLKEPAIDKGKEYAVAPANDVRPVPKFSRRALLPDAIASGDNVQFRRNIVNRLWALMMGRGLVHPVDFDHKDNPPSHPELLAMLADEFGAMKFDMRAFLRELALSKTYQRSSELPPGAKAIPAESFAVAGLKPLSPEQLALSLMQATGLTDAERPALGQGLTEATLHAKLAGNIAPFVAVFGSQPGNPEGQGFLATLDQALFLENGALVQSWLMPRAGNLSERVGKIADANLVADELYLSVLTRLPSQEERAEVREYLNGRGGDRPAALRELAWALLAAAEFRFNH
jgi:hypothetical protein